MTSVATAFANGADGASRANGRKALVGYLPAGFPTVEVAITAARAMVQAGVDAIEIGLPYSDPLMDGPVIADAVHKALTNGTRIKDVLDTVEAVAATGAPTLVMTYWNPVDQYGVMNFARDLAKAGGAGLITPDLSPEEAGAWIEASDQYDLDRIFLVAPSTTTERIGAITRYCRGFVYAVSLMGITGTRVAVSKDAETLVQRITVHTELPVAVGLGVSNRDQAAQVAAFADGVIVGSAFVRRLLDARDHDEAIAQVSKLAEDLANGVRSASPRWTAPR